MFNFDDKHFEFKAYAIGQYLAGQREAREQAELAAKAEKKKRSSFWHWVLGGMKSDSPVTKSREQQSAESKVCWSERFTTIAMSKEDAARIRQSAILRRRR